MPHISRDVVFVDGVRTPFGKAGSMYAETRADDLVVSCIRELVRRHPERVAIVHAKDVHKELTDKLLTGELTWSEGIRAEMFAPIGDGDVDFATIVSLLNEVGFDGYWVLEQDIMLDEDPALGEGPIHNARRSFEALKSLAG